MDYSVEERQAAAELITERVHADHAKGLEFNMQRVAIDLQCSLTRTEGQRDALLEIAKECAEVACAETCDHMTQRVAIQTAECIRARAALSKAGEAANSPLPSPPKGADDK